MSGQETAAPTVYTLADLATWERTSPSFAVLGCPIGHSISPQMHNAALEALSTEDARFGGWRYFRFEVAPEALAGALPLFHAKGFHGLNLTVPHKVLAVGQVEKIEPWAQAAGAVNTLKRTVSGWHGYNTDGYGLSAGLRESLGAELAGADVVLLGAGGAARGAAVECVRAGCRSLWIGNRTPANRDALLADLRGLAGACALAGFDPGGDMAALPAGALIINATSAGMKPTDSLPVVWGHLPRGRAVYDMIYNPPETALLAHAREAGLPTANGLSMLIHQGARALEIWSERSVPVAVMRAAAVAALRARH